MTPIPVIINGSAGVGKDTFVGMCREHLSCAGITSVSVSSVDDVKRAATLLGWDGEKDATGRQFLHSLKMLSIASYDGPMKYMDSVLEHSGVDVVFLMVREPEEISKFVSKYPKTLTVLVRRSDVQLFENPADACVHAYPYNVVIDNNFGLDVLKSCAALDFSCAIRSRIGGHGV